MTLPKQEYIILNSKTQTREKWDYLVLSIADNWMIWRCHGVLFRNNVIREQWVENHLRRCNGNFFRKCHSDSNSSQLCPKFFLNNYEAPWQRHLKDTLQLKILRTWIHVGVNPVPSHLTYYCMFLFLSNKSYFWI